MTKIEITIETQPTENGTTVAVNFTSRSHGNVSSIEAAHAKYVIASFLAAHRQLPQKMNGDGVKCDYGEVITTPPPKP